TSETNPNGYSTVLGYNTNGQLVTATAYGAVPNGAAESLEFSYGSNGLVSEVSDPQGRALFYTYDTNKQLTMVSAAGPSQRAPDNVYSIAGIGTAGTNGNSGQATEAQLSAPVSSTVDASGNVYVADTSNNRV